jgi:hypothetical protein
VVEFDAMLSATLPLPEPFAPLVTVIHDALLVACQLQPDIAADTPIVVLPPAAPIETLVGLIPNAQSYLKVFDGVLSPRPPGPTAATDACRSWPGIGGELSMLKKSTEM